MKTSFLHSLQSFSNVNLINLQAQRGTQHPPPFTSSHSLTPLPSSFSRPSWPQSLCTCSSTCALYTILPLCPAAHSPLIPPVVLHQSFLLGASISSPALLPSSFALSIFSILSLFIWFVNVFYPIWVSSMVSTISTVYHCVPWLSLWVVKGRQLIRLWHEESKWMGKIMDGWNTWMSIADLLNKIPSMIEMFCICLIQYVSLKPHVARKVLKCD